MLTSLLYEKDIFCSLTHPPNEYIDFFFPTLVGPSRFGDGGGCADADDSRHEANGIPHEARSSPPNPFSASTMI
jgi:hypothetical protein